MPQSPWIRLLDHAAGQLDGGARSFSAIHNSRVTHKHMYAAPNEQYQKLFFRKATVPASPRDSSSCGPSAGWLLPDDVADCHPVFIAHSILSAIWLLRETLGEDVLPEESWEHLVLAAHELSQDAQDDAPPSAQRSHSSPPGKRALSTERSPAERPSTPKRARTQPLSEEEDEDASSSHEPEPSLPGGDSEHEHDEPVLITTVTNHNGRAERARRKKEEARAQKKRQSLGLVKPSDDAPRAEHAAYASILPKDEPVLAWILKQPITDDADFYFTSKSPYATATSMLDKARALGNPSARYHAASFLQSWRSRGTPFPTQPEPPPSNRSAGTSSALVEKGGLPPLPGDGLSQRSVIDSAFRHAWNTVNYYDQQLAAVHIQYRWAMAFLGRAYADKITLLQQEDQLAGRGRGKSRSGKGNLRTEARNALLPLVCNKIDERDKDIFKKRLQRATRWYEAATRLGWGSLCLMPYDIISNTWVEQTLRVGEWLVWLNLVEKVNPDAYAASKALDSWLGSTSIAGGPLDGKKTLRIEAEPLTTVYEVEEVQDSEEEEFASTQSQATEPSTGPTRRWRQLTLLELFNPQ